ncbi:unnamed protein product [Urochloa humidicola]
MATAATLQPRVLVLPFPAQGHVMPLMEFSHRLVEHGIEVDFVNTEFNHARVIGALGAGETRESVPEGIHLVSLPDGMDPDGDRTDICKLAAVLPGAMLARLNDIILSNNISWVVADVYQQWALELAAKVGVRVALFSTFSAAVFALRMHVPQIVEDGIIDEWGNVKRNERIQLSPKMPAIDAAELPWISMGKGPESRRSFIQGVIKANPVIAQADTLICNTFQEMESEALALLPLTTLTVGPLEAPKSTSPCHFWPQGRTCLTWLDAQAPRSVIYVAFGSLAIFEATQLQELTDGLVLSGRPFLWVIRPNSSSCISKGWLDNLKHRIGGKGLIVSWAPQQQVLSHPSVACFVTHCGWNSTMEGVRHGVPFLCWPYFADQFCNRSYVCDMWRTGMRLCTNELGVVTKEEIRRKVARLLGDNGIKVRVLSLKSASVR